MKIYTRGGDKGQTSLFGGDRVPKHALRITAYGEVDELNALLGWSACAADASAAEILKRESSRLFSLGAHLATPSDSASRAHLPTWDADCCAVLEREIDEWTSLLPELKSFILPMGVELSCRLQLARTVCRRAERNTVALAVNEEQAVDGAFLTYLNRLSDWLFCLARLANHQADCPEVPWISR
ncbi:MAG: cob(I)yrinic acid a,c-diamide adenosyltransferase [Planctomycetes bacterium]|nr:cob(I)yrinic acid a,c-diamide adenosyltransferase [Planctomycetota bacterium]